MIHRNNGARASAGFAVAQTKSAGLNSWRRSALLGSSALIGIAMTASPAMAQTAVGGGTITANGAAVTDNTGTGGGVRLTNVNQGNTVTVQNVTINQTLIGPAAAALSVEGASGTTSAIITGTNSLTTTVSGNAAYRQTSNGNNFLTFTSSGNSFTGSFGFIFNTPNGFSGFNSQGQSQAITASGTAVTGISVAALLNPEVYLGTSTISGFATGVDVTTTDPRPLFALVNSTGGSINASQVGIRIAPAAASTGVVESQSAITAPTGIQVTGGGGATITTSGGGTINSNAGTGTAISATSAGATLVSVGAAIGNTTAFLNGVNAAATGTGTVNVTSGGAVRVSGTGAGISATTAGGANSVTTTAGGTINGGSFGIVASGATGTNATTVTVGAAIGGTTRPTSAISATGAGVAGDVININANVSGSTDGILTNSAFTTNIASGVTLTAFTFALDMQAGGGTVNNAGTVSGQYGILSNNLSRLRFDNSGTITGTAIAGIFTGSTDAIITNSGVIRNTGGGDGIFSYNSGTVNNTGMISGGSGRFGVLLGGNGVKSVVNSGMISNANTAADSNAVYIGAAGTTSVTNQSGGIITSAGGYGVRLDGIATLNNNAGATISYSGNGNRSGAAVLLGGAATVNNLGTIDMTGVSGQGVIVTGGATINNGSVGNTAALIRSTPGSGVLITGNTASTTNNYGRIEGGNAIVHVDGGTGAVTVNNLGAASIVYGSSFSAIVGEAGGVTVQNAGLIASTGLGGGNTISSSGTATIINNGTIGTGTVDGAGAFTAGGSGSAISTTGNATITNNGTLFGNSFAAITNATNSVLTVTNRGTATAGIAADALASLGTVNVLNSGTVSAPVFSAVNGVNGGSVVNATGGVLMGGNNTTFGEAVQFSTGTASFTNYGTATSTTGKGVFVTNNAATTINLQAGSTTGSILTGNGNDMLALYNGRGTASAGAVDGTSGITLQNAGTLASATVGAVNLGGGTDTLMLRGVGDDTAANGAAGSFSIGTSTGAEILTKADSGTWTLTGAAVTPGITINAGIGGTPGSGGLLVFNGTTGLTGGINVNGATIRAATAGAFGTGTITAIDPTIQYGATGTYTNNIVLASVDPVGDPTRIQADAGVNATLTGLITQSGAPAQPLVFDGLGTITLTNGGNNYAGLTTISNGTVVQSNTASALGSGGVLVNSGAVLQFDNQTGNQMFLEGGAYNGTGTLRFTGNAGSTTVIGFPGNVTISLASGGLVDVVSGTVSGSSNNQGFWTGNLGDLAIAAGAVFNGVEGNIIVDSLTGSGTLLGGFFGSGSTTIGIDNGSGTFTGTIANNTPTSILRLIETGTGTQTLTGVNTYTGDTTITQGTLALGGSGSIANTRVVANATFDVSGIIGTVAGVDTIDKTDTVYGTFTQSTMAGMPGTFNFQASAYGIDGKIIGFTNPSGVIVSLLRLDSDPTYDRYDFFNVLSGDAAIGTNCVSGANVACLVATGVPQDLLPTINAFNGNLSLCCGAASFTATINDFFGNAATSIRSLSGTGSVILGGTVLSLTAANDVFSGSITGTSGGLTLAAGNQTLTGTGSWNGLTTITSGTLTGTTSSISGGSIVDNGLLVYDQTFAGSYAGGISGTGAVNITGTGPVTLSGPITLVGQLAVSGTGAQLVLSGARTGSSGAGVVISGTDAGLTVASTGSVAATGNNSGVLVTSTGASVANAGSITAAPIGINLTATTGMSTIVNSGSISATNPGGNGIRSNNTTALTNSGTIMAARLANNFQPAVFLNGANSTATNEAGGMITGGRGIELEAGGTINNSGQVTGTTDNALTLFGGGSVTNFAGGTLTALDNPGAWGIFVGRIVATNQNSTTVIDNQGTINAGAGIVAQQSNATILNSGTITALDAGVWGFSAPGFSLNNSGTISGLTGVRGAAGFSLVNSGSITATDYGIDNSGGAATITSDGTIGGTTGAIQLVGDFADTLNLGAASITNGSVSLGDGADTLNFTVGATVDSVLDGGAGTDAFIAGGTGSGSLDAGLLLNFENTTKNGTGTLTLTGTATTPANWVINDGILSLSGGSAIFDTALITVNAPGTLDLMTSETIGNLAGAGFVTLGGNLLSLGGVNSSAIFDGVASGTGGITKDGTGLFTVNGSNLYTGTTTVNAGTFRIGASERLDNASTLTVNSGGNFDLQAFNETVAQLNLSGTLTGTGTLTASNYNVDGATVNGNLGGGTLTVTSGTTVLNGTSAATTVQVLGGTLKLGASERLLNTADLLVATAGTFDLQTFNETVGTLALAGTLGGTGTLTAASYTLTGATVNANLGAGILTQASGTSVLNGTAAATAVNVNDGTLTLGASNRLADAANVVVATGATLNLGGNVDTVGTLALNGALGGTGTLTAASYTLTGATVNGNLGAGTLTQAGGTSTLNGTAAATTVMVNAGTLALGGNERLADTALVQIASGATFDLAGRTETIGTLGGTGTVALGAGRLAVGGTNAAFGYGGNISGSGDFDKNGTGTFTLASNLTQTGRLNLNAGTTLFTGSTAGSVRVQGGTLTGSAAIAGNLTINAGAFSPGTTAQPIGQFTAGSLNVSGGTLTFDLGGPATSFAADMIRVSGAAVLTGGTVVTRALEPTANYNVAQTYVLLQSAALTGTFANGATFTATGTNPDLQYRLRYDLLPNAVVLELRKQIDFTAGLGPNASGNELAVGGALNGGAFMASDNWASILNTINSQDAATRRATYNSISGEAISDISSSTMLAATSFNDLLRQRLATGGGATGNADLLSGLVGGKRALVALVATAPLDGAGVPSSYAEAANTNAGGGKRAGVWLQGYGANGRIDGLPGQAGIDTFSAGVAGGIDARVGDFTIGGAFAASQVETKVRSRTSTNEGTLYQGGGYVAYDNGRVYGSVIGSYFSGDIDSRRTVVVGGSVFGVASGTAKTRGYTAGAALGYRLPLTQSVLFTPQVSFTATGVTRDAFTETGAGGLSLQASRDHRQLYAATGEGRLSRVFNALGGVVEPYVGGGAIYSFGDLDTGSINRFSGAPVGTGTFSIQGARLAPLTALVNGGINVRPSQNVQLGLQGEARLSNRQREERVSLNLRIGF